MLSKKVKVRLAPSPTGKLHIGTARTGLFNYLYAKSQNGKYIIRIEDTDKERSDQKYEDEILAGLKWLGLDWDGKPIRQSQRMEAGVYKKYLDQLIKNGFAYPCYCTKEELAKERDRQRSRGIPPKYSGRCQSLTQEKRLELEKKGLSPTYRLNVAKVVQEKELGKILKFNDLIRGEISFEATLIGDFILVKEDGAPLYQFAVVVDDYEMKISDVIRGEDHISNTFNQILLYQALDLSMPRFAHLPLILDRDKSKLSKRKGNTVSIDDFRKQGYLPEALVNFISLLGWGVKEKENEIFSLAEASKRFKLEDINSSGAVFETEKLDFINGYYIRQMSDKKLADLLTKEGFIEKKKDQDHQLLLGAVSLIKDRMKKLSQFNELSGYFWQRPEYDSKLLVYGKSDQDKTIKGLQVALETASMIDDNDYQDEKKLANQLEQSVKEANLSNGDLFWPVRVALSGREASPSPTELMSVFGKEETMERLTKALDKIS